MTDLLNADPTILEARQNLPHDLDGEAAIIGHCLLHKDLAARLLTLQPDHFHSRPHADIWQAIQTIREKGEGVTPFTIAPHIPHKNRFDEMGGIHKYLSGMIYHSNIYPWPIELEKHLIKIAKKRELQFASTLLAQDQSEKNIDLVMLRTREYMEKDSESQFIDNYQVTERILEELNNNIAPTPTGLQQLDGCMEGGLFAKKSYGFAARKKMGKTLLAATISHNLNLAGIKHLFICGEMSAEEVHTRTLCRVLNVKPISLRLDYGKRLETQKKIAKIAIETPKNIFYRNAAGLSFSELKEMVECALMTHSIKGFILDYWQLVGGKTGKQSTAEHLDDVAQWIADYCRQKNLWSIVMAQINQEGNTRGGEGIRLAFDQVYELKAPNDDPTQSSRWMDMRDTRYTAWRSVGSETNYPLRIHANGTHIEQL